MIETNEVGFDKLAFYVGGVSTCASCQIRKAEIKMIEKLIPKINFYEINANNAKDLLKEQKISKIPFFMISCDGKIKEVFYTYPSVESLYIKLLKLVRSDD